MSRRWLVRLSAAAVLLPIAIVVFAGLGRLLRTLGDAAAGGVLDRLALAGGVLWLLALIALLLALGVRQASEPEDELEG